MPQARLFQTPDGKRYFLLFCLICSLFMLWGFCNGMIDAMDKHFQDRLHLTRSQSAWVQFAHYLGYFLIALPAGALCRKLGYKGGIITGLGIVAAGAFWFIPATHIDTFWAFLLGVCVIAMGLTFLETIANPYTTVLGHRDFAATRINLAQSCNGIGFMLGPIIGGMFFYGTSDASINHERLYIPYLSVGIIVLLLAIVFSFARIPDLKTEDTYHLDDSENKNSGGRTSFFNRTGMKGLGFGFLAGLCLSFGFYFHANDAYSLERIVILGLLCVLPCFLGFIIGNYLDLWKHLHVTGGVIAQFLYVAAQAGIFSFFINYIVSDMPSISERFAVIMQGLRDALPGQGDVIVRQPDDLIFINEAGATMLQGWIAFGLFLIGRLVGAGILKVMPAPQVLGAFAAINTVLMLLVFLQLGWISVMAVFGSFFFMSIMFPTIFALGIHGLGEKAKIASSFLVMAIMGGAIMPKLMGWFSDHHGHVSGYYGRTPGTGSHLNDNLMAPGFIVPFFCFLIIAVYGFAWKRLSHSPLRE